jgi:hypothetical protein
MKERSRAEADDSYNKKASTTGLHAATIDKHVTGFYHERASLDWTIWDADYGNLLQLAVALGLEDTVSLLLKYGVDPNVRDTSQKTALHLAAWFGFSQIVKLLLANDADIYAKDESGATPLDQAESSLDNDNHAGAQRDLGEIIQTLRRKIQKVQETDRIKVGMEFLGATRNSNFLARDLPRKAKSVFAMPFWNPGVGFRATIVDIWDIDDQEYLMLTRPNIEDILYNREALDWMMTSKSERVGALNKLRWIHIPVNNVSQIRNFPLSSMESRI